MSSWCEAYNQKVLCQKGYGYFNMNKEVRITKCPLCQKPLEDILNLFLFKGRLKVVGKLEGVNGEIEMDYVHEQDGNSMSFIEKTKEDLMKWDYLELTVTKL